MYQLGDLRYLRRPLMLATPHHKSLALYSVPMKNYCFVHQQSHSSYFSHFRCNARIRSKTWWFCFHHCSYFEQINCLGACKCHQFFLSRNYQCISLAEPMRKRRHREAPSYLRAPTVLCQISSTHRLIKASRYTSGQFFIFLGAQGSRQAILKDRCSILSNQNLA